ncbi:hypothetical protein U3516DRAFT_897498, partial [Neocallimastix sp. 'constans']
MEKFLIWTFTFSWIIQAGVGILYKYDLEMIGRFLMIPLMYIPLIGVLVSGNKLAGMGWKPEIKSNIKYILIAWFSPAILIFIGVVLYFLFFPSHFDLSGEYMVEIAGPKVLEQLKEKGLTYGKYIIVSIINCLTYAPLFNMFVAVGEEAGWRGYLYPKLKEKYGKIQGWLYGGIIWSIWHWPIIWFIGYEYGKDYVGFPVVGMLLFCIFTTTSGIICDWLYERTHCIWVPSIIHGAINASATVTLAVCITNVGSKRLLGPGPMGLISVIPFVLFSIVIIIQEKKKEKNSLKN